jgi:FAD/FMN-containing dehydrogenase
MMFLKFHVREFKIWVGARGTNRIVAGHTFRNLPKPEEIFVHLIGVRQTEEEEVRSLTAAQHADSEDVVAGSNNMGAVADFDLLLPAIRTLVLEDIAAGLPVAADTSTSRRRQQLGRRRRQGGSGGPTNGGGETEVLKRTPAHRGEGVATARKATVARHAKEVRWRQQPNKQRRQDGVA